MERGVSGLWIPDSRLTSASGMTVLIDRSPDEPPKQKRRPGGTGPTKVQQAQTEMCLAAGAAGAVGVTLDGQHDHLGADIDAAVEIDDVLVDHADAARGDPAPDGRGSIGAVDAIDGAAQ